MNVYFVNPTYVKPEGWAPLLAYLKVKAAYSFIPEEELPDSLYSIIKPYLKASYSNQDLKKFSDNCVFWLRAHFEKHIRLITEDYDDIRNASKEDLKKYSSRSALNNLKYLDDNNCLILTKLESAFDEEGTITPPTFNVSELQDRNLPTHITRYCLNILHKKYNHNQYQNQSAFICFNEYFSTAYHFIPKYQNWGRYFLQSKNGGSVNFMNAVNHGIKNLSPDKFPIIDVEGKKRFTLLRTDEGEEKFQQLIKDAEEVEKKYKEENRWREDDGSSWQDEVDEMNRAFWRECGEGGSNCESWPGWD